MDRINRMGKKRKLTEDKRDGRDKICSYPLYP
jgi:hypothetical protein